MEIVTNILVQLDVACGGNGDPAKCELWAAQVLARPDVRGRSLSYLIVTLRDGLSRYTIHDKRLGLEQINKMLNAQDQEIVDGLPTEDEVGEAALKGEVDAMNREEEDRTREVARLSSKVRLLEAKLRTERDKAKTIPPAA